MSDGPRAGSEPRDADGDGGGDACTLCDLPTPSPPVTDPDVEGTYCCRGCLEVARQLGPDAEDDGATDLGDDASVDADEGERAYLAVDGMHCATCEAFVESRVAGRDGVHAADANYAAELLRVRYDPDRVDEAALPGLVDGYGYSARPVDADPEEERDGRLLVGGFFGMMTMVWYVLFLYPHYLGWGGLFPLSGAAGQFLLANVAVMSGVVLGYTGWPILRGAYVSATAGHPNMDLLVALAATNAYVYSLAALLLGRVEVYFDIAVVVVLVVTLGDRYRERVKARTGDLLGDLTRARVEEARVRTGTGDGDGDGDGVETVPVEEVAAGDEVVVRPGERVPVDGVVVDGAAAVDESLVTGESLPRRREPGDAVVGGSVATDGALVVRATEAGSALDRLVRLLWDVQSAGGGAGRLADRLAAVFVPLVLLVAVVAGGTAAATGATPVGAFLTALTVLVVSCPCALGLATPLAVAAGLKSALDRGIVVSDAGVFERATAAEIVVFDKTGTLTTGETRVVDPGDPVAFRRAAAVERFSSHPVGEAVVAAADGDLPPATGFERDPGRGVSADVEFGDGRRERVVVGTLDLHRERGWTVPDEVGRRVREAREAGHAPVVVGWDGRARSVIVAGDEPRESYRGVLSSFGDREVVLLTGDDERAAARFADHVDRTFAGVPPEGKAEVVERLREEGTVAMVGDGTNDAPALATADVGIALGGGTALAADAADVVLTRGIETLPAAFDLTGATRRRVRENLAWALGYNALAIPAAALGALNPVVAAGAMSLSSLLVVTNSARPLVDDEATAGAPGPDAPTEATPGTAD